MDTASVVKAFNTAGLTRVAHDVDQIALPSIRITAKVTNDESQIPLGNSKLGGLPDLAPGIAWPALKGTPMSFIAQIRLSDLQGMDAAKDLPRTGLLSFFYDATQQAFGDNPADRDGWQVIYRDGAPVPASLSRQPAPDALPAQARFKACNVSFAPEWTLPTDPTIDTPNLKWTDAEQSRYEKLYGSFPNPSDHATIHHRLLGHPNTLQDDMRSQCQLVSHGVTDSSDPKAAALLKGMLDWHLLLQVDSDENAGMRWANNGMLYYWIQHADLAARRFDQVWVVLQSE
jgi:uncharacterized protein YwqG